MSAQPWRTFPARAGKAAIVARHRDLEEWMPDLGHIAESILNLELFVLYFACTFLLAFVLGLWKTH